MSVNVIDIIAVATVLLIALFGAKRGFFKVIINLVAYLVSIAAARYAATPISDFIYNNIVKAKLITYLRTALPTGETVKLSLRDILPSSLSEIADFFNFAYVDKIIDGLTSALTPENIETVYLKPVVLKILLVIITVILFFILSLLLGLLARLLNKIIFKKKNGALSTVNKVFGFIFGMLKGCVPVIIICEVLNLIASVSTAEVFIETVSDSYICSFIAGLIK